MRCFAQINLADVDSRDNPLRSIFNVAVQGADGDATHGHAIVAIAEEFHRPGGAATAVNLHFVSGNLQGDVVVSPGVVFAGGPSSLTETDWWVSGKNLIPAR